MKSPKISVVIPSFNKASYIEKTLDSIFDQKYPNLEVVIQDGGSTDGTLEIIRRFVQKYPKLIRLESKKDKGQLDAVNTGMQKTSGEIITFINADDSYRVHAFKKVSEEYLNNPRALWFAGRGVVVNESGKEIALGVTFYKDLMFRRNSYLLLLTVNYLIQPSVFITGSAYGKYGPFTGTTDFITEYELWLKLGKIGMPVIIDEVLAEFRIEPTTKTKRLFSKLLAEDERVVVRYTKNKLILLLHKLNNVGRLIVNRLV
jgi:glycosyltransferase involved in cell wall biosynthesis